MSKEIPLNQLTLFPGDSPVNPSQSQENEEEQTMTAISGMKLLESCPFTNPDGLLAKMWKELLTSKTAWSSDRCKMTWKKKVSKSNVVLFQLAASVRGIKGKESGLLDATQPIRKMTPTPTAQDYIERKCTSTEKENPLTGKSVTLNRFVKHWPNWPQPEMYATPNTMDHLPPRSKEGTLKLQQGHRKGRTRPSNLREQVDPQTMAMYPTPNAWDSARGPVSEDYIKKNPTTQITLVTRVKQEQRMGMYPTPVAKDNCTESLETWEKRAEKHKEQGKTIPQALRIKVQEEAKMYPTPTTQDSRIGPNNVKGSQHRKERGNPALADTVLFPTPTNSEHKYRLRGNIQASKCLEAQSRRAGGRLNPSFVEFLMGYPSNWTKVE